MPTVLINIFFFSIIVIIFIILSAIYWLFKRNRNYSAQDYDDLIPKNASYEYLSVTSSRTNNQTDIISDLEAINLKEMLKNNDIGSIYLVHGTFLGDDPWHIFKLIETTFPNFNKAFLKKLKNKTKKGQNSFAGDLGNFSKDHLEILNFATSNGVNIQNFTWSSGNNHLARLIGAFKLLIELNKNKGKTIFLLGHSHAGQIFSLISIMLEDSTKANYFYSLVKNNVHIDDLTSLLKKLAQTKIIIVTLGTPPRYKWTMTKNIQLYHFINHREKEPVAGSPLGVIFTKSGDYIQQWGIEGSDLISFDQKEKDLNLKLDTYLGVGSNIQVLRANIKKRKRLHNRGHHFLVNYKDNSNTPNFLKTAFGHGCYTKIENLCFIFKEVLK